MLYYHILFISIFRIKILNYKYVVIYKEFSVAHDSFARMTTDAEAGLSITYNAFDLSETVSMGNDAYRWRMLIYE